VTYTSLKPITKAGCMHLVRCMRLIRFAWS